MSSSSHPFAPGTDLSVGRSSNTRTAHFAASNSVQTSRKTGLKKVRRALLGPKLVPGCHSYVTLLATPGPSTLSSQLNCHLTVYKCGTYYALPAPGEWLSRCISKRDGGRGLPCR